MKYTSKIIITLLAIAALLVSFASCGADKNDGTTQASPVTEEAQNPVTDQESTKTLQDLVGDYAYGRCTIQITAENETDAVITADWANSAFENVRWTMHGSFDPDTLRINYSDGEKKIQTFDDNGEITEETVEYSDGVGRIQFYGDGTFQWQDEQETELLSGNVFEFVSAD